MEDEDKTRSHKHNRKTNSFFHFLFFACRQKKIHESPDIINKLTTKNRRLLKRFKEEEDEWLKGYREDFTAHLHLLIVP